MGLAKMFDDDDDGNADDADNRWTPKSCYHMQVSTGYASTQSFNSFSFFHGSSAISPPRMRALQYQQSK